MWLKSLPTIHHEPENFTILENPKDFYKTIIALIEQAKDKIYICALYFENDSAGADILNALYKKKKQTPQIEIYILVDFHRAQRGRIGDTAPVTNVDFYKAMQKKWDNVHIHILGVPVKLKEWKGVFHLKGFVFDNTVLYSGASINEVYLHYHNKYRYDRYFVIKNNELANSFSSFIHHHLVLNPAVISLLSDDIPTIKEIRKKVKKLHYQLSKGQYLFSHINATDQGIQLYPVVGLSQKQNQVNKAILNLLLSAQKSVFMCTPYFNLPRKVLRAIKKLLNKNVTIDIIIGEKEANDFFIHPEEKFSLVGVLPYIYEQNLYRFFQKYYYFIEKGLLRIHLWKHERNSYHLKGLQVDNDLYFLTGSNFNPRAWSLDLENGIILHDEHKHLEEQFMNEQKNILKNTVLIKNLQDLSSSETYPEKVKKVLRRINRIKADVILKRFL